MEKNIKKALTDYISFLAKQPKGLIYREDHKKKNNATTSHNIKNQEQLYNLFCHYASCTACPLASSCQNGSRKSGPHLNTRTRAPRRPKSRASAATTVVLPWPEAGADTSSAGQRTAGPVDAIFGGANILKTASIEACDAAQTGCLRKERNEE